MLEPVCHRLVVLVLLLAGGCAALPPVPWPSELPAQEYFRASWQADTQNKALQDEQEYLLWVRRFYQGYNMLPGWLEMTAQVLERLPAPAHPRVIMRLDALGLRIGAEWAKDNSLRRLSTRTAAVWRDALLESLSRNDLNAYLDRLERDAEALLAGQLSAEDIQFERYYIDEFDF